MFLAMADILKLICWAVIGLVNACCRLQHLQRSTPSHFSKNAPGFSSLGHGHVARGRRRRVSIVVNEIFRVYHSTT
jgi:hypothetical protein